MNRKILTRDAFVRQVDSELAENRQVEFIISSETPDTYQTVFTIAGWQLERYHLNPVVLYAHKSWSDNPDIVIGTSEVRIENDLLIGTITFEDAEINPLAEKVFQKVKAGTLRMASIGADPHEGHWGNFDDGENPDIFYFTKQDLLEWSIIPVGSNPEALKRSVENTAEFIKAYSKPTIEKSEYPSLAVREAEYMLNLKMQK